MDIKAEPVKEEPKIKSYWTRIYFESDDKSRKSTVLACASQEYLQGLFNVRKPEDINLDQWIGRVIRKWESLGDAIFNSEVHYDVYATTSTGERNGLNFLKGEISS